MNIELVGLTEENLQACFQLKVSKEQAQYIASNEDSWKAAQESREVARPFLICCGRKAVGFAMFAFDEGYADPGDRYWLWRFMIDERFQGKGIGTAALREIIRYFREHGADHIRLSTKETNAAALTLYRRAGFCETREMNGGEIVLELRL